MDMWQHVKCGENFSLPKPNQFLTNDFSLLPEESNEIKYPVQIYAEEAVELWYRKDQKFNLPNAFFYYYIINPELLESPLS